jgi:hypothetical protein
MNTAGANDNNPEANMFLQEDPQENGAAGDQNPRTMDDEVEDDFDNYVPDIEVVGLHSPTNGRSCVIHEVCGICVQPGHMLRIVRTVVEINGVAEPAVNCVRVMDGVDGCTVAYLPKIWLNLPKVQEKINDFVVVKELYRDSNNTYKKEKSSRNFGMASCLFLSSIERDE